MNIFETQYKIHRSIACSYRLNQHWPKPQFKCTYPDNCYGGAFISLLYKNPYTDSKSDPLKNTLIWYTKSNTNWSLRRYRYITIMFSAIEWQTLCNLSNLMINSKWPIALRSIFQIKCDNLGIIHSTNFGSKFFVTIMKQYSIIWRLSRKFCRLIKHWNN